MLLAHVIAIDGDDRSALTRDARMRRLDDRREAAVDALRDALIREGLVNRAAGTNGFTPFHRLLDDVVRAEIDGRMHLEGQLARVRRQLENVLASDAFTDTGARRAVLTTINRLRGGERRADAALFSTAEQDLIDRYRRLRGKDRELFRLMLQRLTEATSTGEAEATCL